MKPCGALVLDFCGPGLCENEFLLLKPPGLRCLVMAPRADGDAVAHSTRGGLDGDLLCEPTPPPLLLPPSRQPQEVLIFSPWWVLTTRGRDGQMRQVTGQVLVEGAAGSRLAHRVCLGPWSSQAGPGLTWFILGDLVAQGQGSCPSRTQSYQRTSRRGPHWPGRDVIS